MNRTIRRSISILGMTVLLTACGEPSPPATTRDADVAAVRAVMSTRNF